MTPIQERIAQFRKWTEGSPDDELGFFRLGQLLTEAGEYPEACRCFLRTIELSPTFSKAYQLLGQAYLADGKTSEAIETWTKGWKVADERGDRIPRDEMAKLLKAQNAPVPVSEKPATQAGLDGPQTGFNCQRPNCIAPIGRARPLGKPPFPDELGKKIHQLICADCWTAWVRDQSIKIVNELRLDLSSDFGQEEYEKHMRDFLGFEEPNSAAANPANPSQNDTSTAS
jgi:Fe-S cluster biosynthesis and repair protein YggX